MDIEKIPFSMAGSYLAVSKLSGREDAPVYEEGIYLRSVHGMGYMPGFTMQRSIPFFARVMPVMEKEILASSEKGTEDCFDKPGEDTELDYEVEASTEEVQIKTSQGSVSICFGDRQTLLIRGSTIGLKLKFAAGNFSQKFCWNDTEYLLMNCRTNDRKFVLRCQSGRLLVSKSTGSDGRIQENVLCSPACGEWLLIIEDVGADWRPQNRSLDYEKNKSECKKELDEFFESMQEIPAEYEEAARIAAYVDWSSLVAKEGLLSRDAMLMSKNYMCNVWSWDHCFNAVALSYGNPDLAWDQFMLLFDYQDAMGALPDSVSDTYVARAFCKPPIHGWALSKMMEHMQLSREQCQKAYEKLEKWTLWWLDFRDSDKDGICEYAHGHDSGWDNATVFITGNSVELPDLAAFLILQMETLSELASRLGKEKESAEWTKRAETMLSAMLQHCFDRGCPQCLVNGSHERVKAESLILYLPLILGEKLPKELRSSLIRDLMEKDFLTPYGFATEAYTSRLYDPDGYWRGPIWAPPTLFLVEGLYRSGEENLAKDVAKRFCKMAKQSGFAENYDALTGEGLRDKAYTWTASIFLILLKEYLCV